MLPILGPLKKLLFSRKFMLLVVDTLVSVALYFWSGIAGVEYLISVLQPIFVMLIIAIAVEDAAEKSAG